MGTCGGMWECKWVMGIMKFNETWWTRKHGVFCAHEERGLLRTWLQINPFSKNYLLLHNNFQYVEPTTPNQED
jgi:hypothetical protein